MKKNAQITLAEKEIRNIKLRYKKKYGAVIFDVNAKSFNDLIVLEGAVLSEKQKKEIFLAAKEVVKNRKVENNIKVLSDPKNKLEIGWGVINADIAGMWAKLPDKKNIARGSLASQAVKGDFVRVLAKKGAWSLVQTRDLAIGWAESSHVTISKWNIVKIEWIKTKRARPGEIVRKFLSKNIQDKFKYFLGKYLNVPYLLGGMTERGIDCSGLIERFYSNIFGIFLPRHSSDQALCGEKIGLGAAHFGDLIFFRHKATRLAHIGVVVEKFKTPSAKRQMLSTMLILNARRESGRAAIEELSGILKSYNLIYIKRIIKPALIK